MSVLLLGIIPAALAQQGPPVVHRVLVKNVGPAATSDSLVLANIRTKSGEVFARATLDKDIENLYATGFFYKIQVDESMTSEGLDLTYVLQGKPILTDIKFVGNKKMSLRKLKKKVTSKVGQPLDAQKLFSDAQEMKKIYEKAGYQKTTVTVRPPSIDEATGRGTVTFEIVEAPKVKIKDIVFENATAFPQKKLRGELKTKRRWMFSFLTGTGVLKEEQFDDDKEKLTEFYQNAGYIDFEIKDVKFENVSENRMIVRFVLSEGRQYKVGTLEFKGNKLFTTNDFLSGIKIDSHNMKVKMVPGQTFTPVGMNADTDTIRDIYGSRGFLDAEQLGTTRINAIRTPNPTTGTMDLVYEIEEGEKTYIEKIEIKGNVKTKDRVIRRELAVSPGETYDMVMVKLSKARLEGLDYFEKIDAQAEETDVPNRKNLVVGVEEKNTGNITLGAGFSSVDSVVGFVELTQGNFDLFNWPTFTGAGQKFRIRTQLGLKRQDYEMTFIEPWFMGRKIALGVDLFHRELDFVSLNSQYNEQHSGATISLTKALGSDYLQGKVSYTIENTDLRINPGFYTGPYTNYTSNGGVFDPVGTAPPNLSTNIYNERGSKLTSKIGASIAYDTRNSVKLPDKGQRSEINVDFSGGPLGGDVKTYSMELRSGWYFKGFAPGHVIELAGRGGVIDGWGSDHHVPIYDRWFLGGLYSLRGYRYRQIGPHDQFGEPLGGNSYMFGTAEYSLPIIERVRFAMFYDAGNVYDDAFSFKAGAGRRFLSDNWGLGLRLNLPIGPLRLDYGIPIQHDKDVNGSGRFQIGVGYQREF